MRYLFAPSVLDYVKSLPDPDLNILTQIDKLSRYMDKSPELNNTQEYCMNLIMSIAKIRTYDKSILGLPSGANRSMEEYINWY